MPVQEGREHVFGLIVQALALDVPFGIVGPVFYNAKTKKSLLMCGRGMGEGCCRGWWD